MRRALSVTVVVVLAQIVWVHTADAQSLRSRRAYGPPPYRHVRIVGEPVPGWTPEDMLQGSIAGTFGLTWYPVGPKPITGEYWSGNDHASGRVVSIAVHPTNPDTVYIASASGGMWKTTNGGSLWVPMTDELSTLNHGCVTLDPSNPQTIYLGTGEYQTGSTGNGIFRSYDGGVSWAQIATAQQVGPDCSRLVVNPDNPMILHHTGSAGYTRSLDGGATWTKLLSDPASDVVIKPGNTQVLFVGRPGKGLFRSTNGGQTFSQLFNGIPVFDVHRTIVTISPAAPDTVYAAMINGANGLKGLYKSTNGGNSWTKMENTPDFPWPQGWYDFCLAVSPVNENLLYAGGVFPDYAVAGLIRSTDGGTSWVDVTRGTEAGQLHPDQHAIAFGPDGTVWVGNDGGVWKSHNAGQTWLNTNATLTVTQNYCIALHPTDPVKMIAGTQDNGSIMRNTTGFAWPQIIGGDGGFAAYDHADPSRYYTTYVFLTIFRFDNFGWAEITGPWAGEPVNFIAPLVIDPNDARTLLGGTNRVWRTHNADTAADWSPISPTTVSAGGRLNAIAVAPGHSDIIYTGSSTGKVYATFNGSTWEERSGGLPSGEISDVVINPQNPQHVFVSYYNTGGPRVLRTMNGGQSWQNVTETLPEGTAARALAVDWRYSTPGLFIGSGSGVYYSYDHGQTWVKDGLDLPNVNTGDLAINTITNRITVGTYGRGAWTATLPKFIVAGDLNGDNKVDLQDWKIFRRCISGPDAHVPPGSCSSLNFSKADLDADLDVDLDDIAIFWEVFGD